MKKLNFIVSWNLGNIDLYKILSYLGNGAGIYMLRNTLTNVIYIGSSISLKSRLKDHLKNRKSNRNLQDAIKSDG